MNLSNPKLRFLFATIVLMVGFLTVGGSAQASVLFQQSDFNTEFSNSGYSNSVVQFLGNGLTGTANELCVKVEALTHTGSFYFGWQTTDPQLGANWDNTGLNYIFSENNFNYGDAGIDCMNFSNFDFNPDHYYFIVVGQNFNQGMNFKIFGSDNSNAWKTVNEDLRFFVNSFEAVNAKDIYFTLNLIPRIQDDSAISTSPAPFWYQTLGNGLDFSVKDLTVHVSNPNVDAYYSGTIYGFLTADYASGYGIGVTPIEQYNFSNLGPPTPRGFDGNITLSMQGNSLSSFPLNPNRYYKLSLNAGDTSRPFFIYGSSQDSYPNGKAYYSYSSYPCGPYFNPETTCEFGANNGIADIFFRFGTAVETLSGKESAVTADTALQTYARIDGNLIAWLNNYRDINVYEISTGHKTVVNDTSLKYSFLMEDRKILWTTQTKDNPNDYDRATFLYDFDTGITTEITEKVGMRNIISDFDGQRIVLQSPYGSIPGIYLYDLTTSQLTLIDTNDPDKQQDEVKNPKISGNKILYSWGWTCGMWCSQHEIRLYDIANGEKTVVATDSGWYPITDYSMDGDNIILATNVDIYGGKTIQRYKISNRDITTITSSSNVYGLDISGDIVVWSDQYDIFIYDLTTGKTGRAGMAPKESLYPKVSGNTVVWDDYRNVESSSVDIYMYQITPPNHPPTKFWAEISSGEGSLMLRSEPATSATALKHLPDGWAIYVTNTKDNDGNVATEDGYRWYQVRDETDGTTGWMQAGKWTDGAFTGGEYLKNDAGNQADLESKTKVPVNPSSISVSVEKAINHFYKDAADADTKLDGGKYGVGSLSFLRTNSTPFPEQLIAAMVLQESEGIVPLKFDNSWVASDFGFGTMQVNTYGSGQGYVGSASHIGIPLCDGNVGRANCFEPGSNNNQVYKATIAYRYYINSLQGIYSNVKDGLAKIFDLYTESIARIPLSHLEWKVLDPRNNPLTITVPEMRILRTVRGYNGFGFKGTDLNGDGDYDDPGEADYCYRFEKKDKNNYLAPVADQLLKVATNFPSIQLDAPSDIGDKMKAVELHKTEVSLCSPGVLRIIDGNGDVTGQDQTNIPTTLYGDSGKAAVVYLADDSYKYQVVGTEAGTYSLYFDTTTSAGTSTVQLHNIPLSLGEVYTYQIDSAALARGERGVTIQIDANGDGVIEKTIYAGSELSADEFRLLTETVVNIDPDTLNRKNGNGVMTAYIELPSGFDVHEIDAKSVTLNGKPTNAKPVAIADYDNDGIPDLMVKFDRGIIISMIPPTGTTTVMSIAGHTLHNGKTLNFGGDNTIKLVQ